MKLRFFIFLSALVIFYMAAPLTGWSQGTIKDQQLVISPQMQFEYAQSLFDKNDWDTAQVEFKRFLHFFPDSEKISQAEFNTGLCLFNLNKFQAAAKVFNRIILSGREDQFTDQAYFLQSRAFLHLGNIGYAQIVLQNYLKLTEDENVKDRIYFSLAKIELLQAKKGNAKALDKALEYLSKLSENARITYDADQYQSLIIKARQAPKKNPTAAGIFSIIPGGGFLYCERYKDALTTFLLNAGLMFAAYEAWDNDNKALAGVIGFVETGFYSGNIYGSISAAHKHNRARTIQILGEKLDNRLNLSTRLDPEQKGVALVFSYLF